MKIGIIVFSHTGNAYTFAQRLQKVLSSKGYSANVERVTQKDSKNTDIKNIQLEIEPETDKYDVIIFGSPVWAFSLSPIMTAYLRKITNLQNKKIACFVTKALPFSWTGGNRSINQMRKIIESKNTNVSCTGIITQKSIKDEVGLEDVINKFCSCVVSDINQ